MALTSAMITGLTGLQSNQAMIDTIGDNIANVNTTAFKSSRTSFENQFAITLSGGTGPSGTSGGTNPLQIGMGSLLSSIQRNFQPGAIETTGVPTDLAVEGAGFFIVDATGQQAFTRDGTFRLDADNNLVTSEGFAVRGYGVNDDYEIQADILTDLNIPLGQMRDARPTSEANFDGNLNGNGTVATQGTILQSQVLEEGPGSPASETSLLTGLFDPDTPGSALFVEGDVLTVASAKKGGRQLPETTFTVTAGSTLGEFASFLEQSLGINQDEAIGGTPGISISQDDPPGAGVLVIEGNPGQANGLEIDVAAIRSTNANFPAPFQFTQAQEAVGESVFTSFIAYDSLGTPVQMNLTLTLENKTNAGNTWRFYAESFDDTDASPVLGQTGTLTFDPDGQVTDVTNNSVQIDLANTGALTPLQITLDFANVTGLTTQDEGNGLVPSCPGPNAAPSPLQPMSIAVSLWR